jgi:hypothetical protein
VREIANKWSYVREQFDKNRKNRVEVLEDYLLDFEKRISEVTNDTTVNVHLFHVRNRRKSSKTCKIYSWRFRATSSGWMTLRTSLPITSKRHAET